MGNSNIPVYLFLSGYNAYSSDPRGNSTSNAVTFSPDGTPILTYTLSNLPNRNIKWETTKELNIGLDGELFNGKLYFSLDWYKKKTIDLLYTLPIPISSGFSNFITNIGTTQNTGVDLLISYKDKAGKFDYNLSLTGTYNTNKVTSLPGTDGNPILCVPKIHQTKYQQQCM